MKKITLTLLICLLTTNCNIKKIQEEKTSSLRNYLEYYKDTHTGLCFAGMYIGSDASTITNVPCTSEVERIAFPF